MNAQPLISVITPVYNGEGFLDRCIGSILNQTYKNIEYILINDGSTDRTAEILQGYARSNPCIRIIDHDKNRGISAGRATGVSAAKGDYIVWLDADDEAAPDMIECLVNATIKHNVSVVLCNFENMKKDGRKLARYNMESDLICDQRQLLTMLVQSTINQTLWARIVPRSYYDKTEFREGLLYEDVDNAYKLYLQTDRFVILKKPLIHRYYVPSSICHTWNLEGRLFSQKLHIDRARYLDTFHPGIEKAYYERCFNTLRNLRRYILHSGKDAFKKNRADIDFVVSTCRSHTKDALNGKMPFRMRIEFRLMATGTYAGFLASRLLCTKLLRTDLPELNLLGTPIDA